MAPTSRTPDSGVSVTIPSHLLETYRALQEAPGEFDFFQAVRLLHLMFPDGPAVGGFAGPEKEIVRFVSNTEMAFPPSQIEKIDWTTQPPALTFNFMGLAGAFGVLPQCYTEFVNDRLREKDSAPADFLDIFNHRAVALFYRAWEKYRFDVAFERRPQDRFSQYLLCLIGLGTPGLQGRLKVPDKALLFYTGVLALQTRSAEALEAILSDYFDVPAQVEDFVGSWQLLPESDYTVVDDREEFAGVLGETAIVGDAVWDQQSKIRLQLGPMSRDQYLGFLPDGEALPALQSLVSFFCDDEAEIELQLILRREDVRSCHLGAEGRDGPRLGWLTWIKSDPESNFDRNPQDTVLQLA